MIGFPPGCFALLLFFGIVILFPFLVADVVLGALAKLGLGPQASVFVALGVFAGSLINIPVHRIRREEIVSVTPRYFFGLGWLRPRFIREQRETVIAVNVGGALIPFFLALYQLLRLWFEGTGLLFAAVGAVAINTAVCYRVSRPVQGLGIAIPALIPGLVAAVSGLLLAREHAPQVACAAGVMGPLFGADLLRLRDISRISTGAASIGGAGTFDGIVISGLLATLLA